MERVLLINPGQTYYGKAYRQSAHGSLGLPLGLLYIAAVLERAGCQVQVLDSLASPSTVTTRHEDHVHIGLPPDVLAGRIREAKPDIVGLSSQFTAQEEDVVRTAALVKDVDDSITVVVGGANVSCRATPLLESGKIDIAVRSEGEGTIRDLIDFHRGDKELGQIPGIAYRDDGRVRETTSRPYVENLDALPLPAYHLIDMESYLTLYKRGIYTRDRDVRRNLSMITSRGCPYSCVFCSISQSMGKAWRPHSSDHVIHHVEVLSRDYGVRHIHFEDDNMLFEPERFLPVLDVLAREKITWDTPNGVRVDLRIDEEMLRHMRSSGCKSLTIGVESGDAGILKNVVRKGLRLDHVPEFAGRCKRAKVPLRAFFVIGFPGETLETMQRTVDFALHLLKTYDVEIINLIATPLFGTRLYDICVENGYLETELTPRMLSEATASDGHCLIHTDAFSPEDVERMSREFTARVYRRMLLKGLAHPLASMKRVGNLYVLKRTLKRMLSLG